jgi:hypothetical protein
MVAVHRDKDMGNHPECAAATHPRARRAWPWRSRPRRPRASAGWSACSSSNSHTLHASHASPTLHTSLTSHTSHASHPFHTLQIPHSRHPDSQSSGPAVFGDIEQHAVTAEATSSASASASRPWSELATRHVTPRHATRPTPRPHSRS